MATGGGPPNDGDFANKWKHASAFMDRREQTNPASQESAGSAMDQDKFDPGDLHKDLQDMSIQRDIVPQDIIDQEDEVSDPPSIVSSVESLPSDSDSDVNKTTIFVKGPSKGPPQTSTPKGNKKPPKPKVTKPKSATSALGKKPEKHSNSPSIQTYLVNNNQPKKSSGTPRPVTPNILDWFDAVDLPNSKNKNPTSSKDTEKLPKTAVDIGDNLSPLPQREKNKSTKRKRVGKDGKCLVTATSSGTLSSSHDDDVMDVNKPSPMSGEERSSGDDLATPASVPWLLGNYAVNEPLPESLIGKKVRFQPEPTKVNTGYAASTDNNITQPVANHASDSFQDGPGTFLNIPEEALSFFKRARGCLSAAARADARATRIDELINREMPAPWALRLEPIPAYLRSVAHELTERQRTNALQLMQEATHSLRRQVSKMVTQGNENWNIVNKYLADDDDELNKVRVKMDGLVARDFDREKIRLDAHNAVLIADPVTDAAIVENLRVRGYNNPNKRQRPPSPPRRDNNIPPNRAYDNPQPGSSNMGARPMDPNPNYNTGRGRGKRRRSRSRSRSRSPNSGRGRFNSRSGPPNRGRGRGGAPRFNQRQPSNNRNNMDPQAMAAIVRQVVQEMNQPTNQNQRGSRDYRY